MLKEEEFKKEYIDLDTSSQSDDYHIWYSN